MAQSRAKLFIENFLVYGLGSVMSKIVPLFMLPIVTRLMPNTSYYGLNDISNIVVSFGSSIAVMGMYDVMFRMFFDREDLEYKKEVCSSAFYFTFFSGLLIAVVLLIFKGLCSQLFFSSEKYSQLLTISAISVFVSTISSIVIAPTRMLNKRKIFLVTNTITPILSYSISIPMLIHKMYITALPLAGLVSSVIILIVFYFLNTDWFNFKKVNKNLIKEMLKLGIPLMPTFLLYWVFNSCDRIFIAKYLGNAQVGIYGIGARVASISQFIYIAFANGWQYFAFSTMKSDDQVELTSNVFEYLGVISFSTIVILTPFSDMLFRIFFKGDYIKGAIVFPYLFLAPLLLMLYQTEGNQFLVIKKTWPGTLILILGALTNVLFNYLLIPILGIEGSALATLLGYVITVLVCSIVLNKMKLIIISKRFLADCLITVVFFVLWRIVFNKNFILTFLISILTIICLVFMYKSELILIKNKLSTLIKKK